MEKILIFLLILSAAFTFDGINVNDGPVNDFQCFKEKGFKFYLDNFSNKHMVQNLQSAKSQQMPANFQIEPDTKISVSDFVQEVKAKVDATLFTSLYISIAMFPTSAQQSNCQYLQNLAESLAAAYPNNQIGVYGVFNPVWATTFGTYCDSKLTKFQVWYAGKDQQTNFNDWTHGTASFGGWKVPNLKTVKNLNMCGHSFVFQLYKEDQSFE